MEPKDLKKKFRVGISGHRDLKLSKIDQYKREMTNILEELVKKYPDNEIFVVTALADGADRLMVECAVALGLRYEVILPMPVELYRDDFDEMSKKEFDTLFLNASASKSVALLDGILEEQIKHYGKERDRQYLAVGEEVVNRSDTMLFLWDGVVNGLTGGTADIVEYTKHVDKSYFIIKCKRKK